MLSSPSRTGFSRGRTRAEPVEHRAEGRSHSPPVARRGALPAAERGLGLRLALEDWFRTQGIPPRVVGTFEDSALIDAFGQAGAGLCAMPTVIEPEVQRQYRVRLVGRLDKVRQRFYAITVERKLRSPAVIAISERARALFKRGAWHPRPAAPGNRSPGRAGGL